MTWGEIYQANLARGYDHGYAAWRADQSEKRHKETVSVTRPEGLGSGRKIEPVFDQDER